MNRLEQISRDMESLFVQKLFQTMRQGSHPDWDITGNSQASQTYQDLLDAERAKDLANGPGIGLWRPLYEQLSIKDKSQTADNTRWEETEHRRFTHESH